MGKRGDSSGKKVGYKYIGKESLRKTIGRSLPREMIPSNLTGKILGYVFLVVVIISFLQFPLNSFIGGDLSKGLKVGLPLAFLEFDLEDPSKPPINYQNFMLDIFFYLVIAYIIEVILNIFSRAELFGSKNKLKKKPKVFKDRKQTISNKVVGEVFKREVIGGKGDVVGVGESVVERPNSVVKPATGGSVV